MVTFNHLNLYSYYFDIWQNKILKKTFQKIFFKYYITFVSLTFSLSNYEDFVTIFLLDLLCCLGSAMT